jgi:hypothetical protein
MKTRLFLAAVVLIGLAAPIHQNALPMPGVVLMDGICCGGDPDAPAPRPLPLPLPAPTPTK